MKKILSLSLALILVFSLAACSGNSKGSEAKAPDEEAQSTAEPETSAPAEPQEETGAIAVTIPTAQSPFCNDFALGVKAAAEELGWTCTIDDPNVQLEAQITAIENFVTSGVKGIVVFPVDGNGVADATQKAMNQGVIITANDNNCPANLRVAEDEVQTGRTLAQPGIDWGKANTDGKIKVAIIAPNEAEDSRNGRILKGLIQAIEEELPEAEIVSIQKSNDSSEVMALIENIVQANPDVQLFYNQLDDTIATETLRSLGYDRDDVCLIGAGGNDDSFALIAQGGVFRGTITTDIYNIGYQCGLATIAAIKGETPQPITTNYTIVTSENISEFYKG
ncbi:MAG: sugar ABC transporter substrate-binding protein [Oscillospiraceae bacterium]|jgi:ribose transport system substrate-binding protein